MSDNMTKLPGTRNSSEVLPGMAYWQGTGPKGQTCGTCKHRGYWSKDHDKYRRGCFMFNQLSGGVHGPAVRMFYRACKYWSNVDDV